MMSQTFTGLNLPSDAFPALNLIFRNDFSRCTYFNSDMDDNWHYFLIPQQGSGIPSWVVPTVTFLTALLVAGTNFLIQRWRFKIDRLGAAIDQLANEINSGADLALSFWLLDCTQAEQRKHAGALEPQLIGRQNRIRNLFLALQAQDSNLHLDEAETSIDDLFDWMTGHTFGDVDRLSDPQAGRKAQTIAALLHGQLRTALNRRTNKML